MKDKIILTGKHGRPSSKIVYGGSEEYGAMTSGRLVQRRQVFRGTGANRVLRNQYYRTFENNNSNVMIKKPSTTLNNTIAIRWGTREVLPTDGGSVIYNKATAIANATDKKLSRELFIANNVSTPKLVTADNVEDSDLPIIARPFVHSKGRNFVELNSIAAFRRHWNPGRWYYSAFVDKTREFRVHVGHSKVIALMEKHPVEGSIAWNRAVADSDPFDYIAWDQIDEQNLKPVMDEAIKAVLALEMDMGGVDVMITEDGTPYVLEVNSAPTLNSSPYVAHRWGRYFDWLFREETRRDHWDWESFTRGKSLVWKNYQLADEVRDTEV